MINIDNSRCDDNAQGDQSTVPTRSKGSLINIDNTRCDDNAPTSHDVEYISLKIKNADLMDDSTRTQPKISNSNDLSNDHAISKRDQPTSKVNSQSKRFSPCPFLSRRGWCVKGDRCDFKHPIKNKHMIPCPFLQKKGYCLKRDKCDFSHKNLPRKDNIRPVPPAPFFPSYQTSAIPIQLPQYIMHNQFPQYHQAGFPLRRPRPLMEIPIQHPFQHVY